MLNIPRIIKIVGLQNMVFFGVVTIAKFTGQTLPAVFDFWTCEIQIICSKASYLTTMRYDRQFAHLQSWHWTKRKNDLSGLVNPKRKSFSSSFSIEYRIKKQTILVNSCLYLYLVVYLVGKPDEQICSEVSIQLLYNINRRNEYKFVVGTILIVTMNDQWC